MAQGTLWLAPIQRAFANNGTSVAASCRAYFYLAGTTTPVNVYSDVGLTTAITQPVVADANGIFQEVFLTPGTAYKVDVQTSAGVSLTGYPADNQLAIPASSSNVQQTETAGEPLTAGLVAYLSDGSGGKNTGQLYKGDSANPYSSTLPTIGLVPSAIGTSATGGFVTAGQVTGLSSLSNGSDYYVGTGGALTATPPANARLVGRADSTTSLIVTGNPRTFVNPAVCQGRLTLTSGVPVTTADVTGASTVYFTPYGGNLIALYDGANWGTMSFAEISIALGTLTSGLPYDVFAYNNSGTLALELLAWTNTTTRATALALQNGIYVKTGVTTRRYLGTFFTTSTTQTEDSVLNAYLWNYYNRVDRDLLRQETTASWTYTTATIRQANGAVANQVNLIVGVAEDPIHLWVHAAASNSGTANLGIGIGKDSTTTVMPTQQGGQIFTGAAGEYVELVAHVDDYPAAGKHSYSWNEWSAASGTTTWLGSNIGIGAGPGGNFSGISGWTKH